MSQGLLRLQFVAHCGRCPAVEILPEIVDVTTAGDWLTEKGWQHFQPSDKKGRVAPQCGWMCPGCKSKIRYSHAAQSRKE